MKSTASIKGHPIHPILVAFPIAFFTGTLLFDILAVIYDQDYTKTALHLEIAGLVGAVLAAVPGIIDYIYTVPPRSSGKKRATSHALTNTAVLLCFGAALVYRQRVDAPLMYVIIGLEAIGEILMLFAGWMGGTLVYRNQIGVDPRYANAGKWKEEHLKSHNDFVIVGDIDTIKINQMRLVHTDGRRIVIANTESGYVAFDDRCPHRGGSLAGGAMICGTVQCPWHGSQFSVQTGSVQAGPAKEGIVCYRTRIENGKLIVQLSNL